MWERFGYYLLLGIFILYAIEPTNNEKPGLGLTDKNADDIFGTYLALTYLTPFIGGFLAERVIGYIKSIYLGGILMALGYIGVGLFQEMSLVYLSLASIVIGNGFFKPTISTLLGNLYSEPEYKAQKDTGYNIFYMGINIGAFICNIIAAFMRNRFSWDAAFISAGVGLLAGLVIFSFGRKHLVKASEMKPAEEGDSKISDVLLKVFLPAIVAAIIGYFIPKDIFGSDITDAFIFACVPVIYFYASLYFKAKEDEKKPIGTLLSIFLVSMFFWAIFKQNGTALTRWANYYTDREIPAKAVPIAKSLYLVDGIGGTEGKFYKDKEVSVYNEQFQAQKDNEGKTKKELGKDVYFKNISSKQQAELEKNPDKPVYLFNTELLQSVNPFWVIALTPFYIFLWTFLRKRGKEPTTASKIVLGLFLTAISCLVMVAAVHYSENGAIKASALWLVAAYGAVTLGELCLSPMGLSITSKLSPKRITNLMMGGFFLANSVGNKLSGILSSTWYSYENKMNYFLFNFSLLIFATILGLLMLKKWNAVMKEKGV